MKNTLLSLLTIILIAGCRSSPSQKIDVLKDLVTKQLGKEAIIQKNKPEMVFKFLDNESNLAEDIKIITALPILPFLKAGFQEVFQK